MRCIRELDSPYFMHEVVKRLVVLAVETTRGTQLELAADLLCSLRESGVLSEDALHAGLTRVLEVRVRAVMLPPPRCCLRRAPLSPSPQTADDLALDVPETGARLGRVLAHLISCHALAAAFLPSLPQQLFRDPASAASQARRAVEQSARESDAPAADASDAAAADAAASAAGSADA